MADRDTSMEEILEYCSGKIKLGIITNGPSEHQWNEGKSLQVKRTIHLNEDAGNSSRIFGLTFC